MADHKFKIGQMVLFCPKRRPTDRRPYRVVQILSAPLGESQYRIKSTGSEREFTAKESELRPKPTYAARY